MKLILIIDSKMQNNILQREKEKDPTLKIG